MERQSFKLANTVNIRDVGAYVDIRAYGSACARLQDGPGSYDRVVLSADQYYEISALEQAAAKTLPEPFTDEVLQDFCLEISGTDYLAIFQQSKLPPFTLADGRQVTPKVDCAIGRSKNGKCHLGGIGLIQVKKRTKVCYYWVGEVKKASVGDSIIDILSDYFVAQYAFYSLPDRIVAVESKPADEEHVANPTTPRKPSAPPKSPRTVHIRRTIYVHDGEATPRKNRKFERHCLCWFVRKTERTIKDKDGKERTIIVRAHFKGSQRDNPDARQRIKYVP